MMMMMHGFDGGPHGPSSAYVTTYWLPLLGPGSCVTWSWLTAQLPPANGIAGVTRAERGPSSLGLSEKRFTHCLDRLTKFGFIVEEYPPQTDHRLVAIARGAHDLSERGRRKLAVLCPWLELP